MRTPSTVEQHQRPYQPPADSREILLVRHGASEAAILGAGLPLFEGQADPALSEVGREQAALVGEALTRSSGISGLFVSSLRRTQETAEPIAAATNLEVQILPDLREIFLGSMEGGEYRIRVADGDPVARRVAREERWDVIPGAESLDAFGARLGSAIDEIVAAVPVGTAAIAVVHGGVIGQLCSMATGSRPFAFSHADNCSISSIVVHGSGRWLLRSFNQIVHLEVR
jgi:2,3-bisphosphoglycerate-dependent phosphoglycerate mutase